MSTSTYVSNQDGNTQTLENLYVTTIGGEGNSSQHELSVTSIYTWDQFMNELEFE